MGGNRWVKFWESITQWEWYKDANTARLFFHLVIKAQYKDTRWQGYDIPKGCVVTSRKRLREELGVSDQNIRTAIKHLTKSENIKNVTNGITNLSKANFTIFKVENYDYFQGGNEQDNQQVTNSQPTDNQQVTTYKKDKKERSKEIKKNKQKESFSVKDEIEKSEMSEELKLALLGFLEMRKNQKKPVATARAWHGLLNDLNKLSNNNDEKIAIVDQSTKNCWLGFYELKQDYYKKPINQGLPDWYAKTEFEPASPELIEKALEAQRRASEPKKKQSRTEALEPMGLDDLPFDF